MNIKKYHYTYKITLLKGSLSGKYYLGKHSTNNIDDDYAGSGKIIWKYYKKYGKIEHQTYIKEIIAFYDNDDELNKAEYKLIGMLYKNDPNCLNLTAGGGYSYMTVEKISNSLKNHHISDETRKKISEATKRGMDNPMTRKKCSENAKKTKNFAGHKHTEETKQIIGEKKKGNKNRLGIGFTDEAKKRISNSLKEFFRTHKRQINPDGSYKYILIENNEQ